MSRASENNIGAPKLRNICSFVALYFFSLLVPFYSIAIVLPTPLTLLEAIFTRFSFLFTIAFKNKKERQQSQNF